LLIIYQETCKIQIGKKLQFTNGIRVFLRALAQKKIRTLAFIYVCFQTGWALYLQTNFLALIQKYNYSGRLLGYFSLWMGFIFCLFMAISLAGA